MPLRTVAVSDALDAPGPSPAPDRSAGAWWLAFGAVALVAFVLVLVAGHGLTFFFDEWTWILDRRDVTLDTLLQPHYGHLSLVPVAMYQMLFHSVGIRHYWPYRVMIATAHVGVAALVFAYLRRRVAPVAALAGAALVLAFGAAWQVILWPFQTSFAMSLVGGIGALLFLDRRTRRGDVGAASMGLLALASSGVGVPLVAGVGLEIVLRRQWRRLWVVLVPGALYALWWAAYGERKGEADGVVGTARWAVEFAGATVGGLTGTGSTVGQVLLLPLAAVFVWGFLRADADRRPRVGALVAMLGGYWLLIAFSRSGLQEPTTSRYLYAGGVLLVLALGECGAGISLRVPVAAVLAVVITFALVVNVVDLFDGGDELRGFTEQKLAEVSAIDIGTRTLDPGYVAVRVPPPIDGRPLVDAFADLGSPALDVRGVRTLPDEYRRQADGHLAATVGMGLTGATQPGGARPDATRGGPGADAGASCVRFTPGAEGVDVEVVSSTRFLRIEAVGSAPVDVRLRAFGDGYFAQDPPYATVPEGEARDLPTPHSAAPRWRVGLRSAEAFEVCGTTGPTP